MRILAVDYGTKNVGLALSDESLTIAMEQDAKIPVDFFNTLRELIQEKEIEKILVGMPIGLSGQETLSTKAVQKFIQKIKKMTDVEIEAVDERFTTDLAKRMRPGHGHHDSLAAQIILQEYLDKDVSKPYS